MPALKSADEERFLRGIRTSTANNTSAYGYHPPAQPSNGPYANERL